MVSSIPLPSKLMSWTDALAGDDIAATVAAAPISAAAALQLFFTTFAMTDDSFTGWDGGGLMPGAEHPGMSPEINSG
ncbi:hypothetical protein BHE97_07270 [Aeromicrobium sp. PE09-221]|nr:hypothetical protein BHE97_07270 [Aeromicrobium sp. PE09-221]